MSNIKRRNTYYHSELNKYLCFCLILNSLFYFLGSRRAENIDNFFSGAVFLFNCLVTINYKVEIFSLINFALIVFITAKTLFSAKRIPFFLTAILLFILNIDSNIAELLFRGKEFYTGNFLNDFYSSDFVVNKFIKNEYALENLNYFVTFLIVIYTYAKIATWDKICFNRKTSRKNKVNHAKSHNKQYSNNLSSSDRRYHNDDYYYNEFPNNPYGLFKKIKFKIRNDFDKRDVYDKRFTNAYDKVEDENGTEKYVWEYANEYENNIREEEQRRVQQEQDYYNYNNNSYNYNPYDDRNSYGGNDWTSNTYNNNDNWY